MNNTQSLNTTRLARLGSGLVAAAVLALCLAGSPSALAAPNDAREPITPEISQTLTNAAYAPNRTFDYLLTLKTISSGSRYPLGLSAGSFTLEFSLTGNENRPLGSLIDIIDPGAYVFELKCTTSGFGSAYTVDMTVYTIEVNVDSALIWWGTFATANGATAKADAITYAHTYTPPGGGGGIIVTPPSATPSAALETAPDAADVEIGESGVPGGEWQREPDDEIDIPEEYPPLGDITRTGDASRPTLYAAAAAVSLLGLVLLRATEKRRFL